MDEVVTQPLPDDTTESKQVSEGSDRKRHAEFRQRIQACKSHRKKLITNWTTNIDYRRGKPFTSQGDEDSIVVNLDWSYTKTKQAALFSQVPKVRISHSPESVTSGPWVAKYERKLNDKLVSAGIEAAMDEVLPDVINAAGFGVALVAYESITEMKEVPSVDLSVFPPHIQMTAMQSGTLFGQPIEMKEVPHKAAARYTVRRISPADFLWPIDFTGSDFDNAPWLGYTGRIPWAEAVGRFGLTEDDKPESLTEEKTIEDRLSHDYDREHTSDDNKVGFDEIFYHEYQYDTEAKSYETIHHLVFLHGKSEPVIDEAWKGQLVDPSSGKVIGARKKPLRVLTLAYISDEDIPPSDTAIGRSQVNELNRGRMHISKQRARSIPFSWFDVNRLDPTIQQALMRGTWQHAVPVQGDGTRILGTVVQPAMHQENFLFDKIAKEDAQDAWGLGPNQTGVGGNVETKGEANIIQNNFATKVGRERAKTAAFFLGIAEVLGGLICLFEDPKELGEGFDPGFSEHIEYSILADSTVLLDSTQRLERLNNFLDSYAKTGWVNVEPVLKEIATLVGLDPNSCIEAPKPKEPELPNISLRLSGAEDMMNPLLLAFMLKTGQAPDPELVNKAKELIAAAVAPQPPVPPQGPPPQGMPPGGPGQPPPPGQLPSGPMPQPPPPNIGEAMPDAALLPTIGKRAQAGDGQEHQ